MGGRVSLAVMAVEVPRAGFENPDPGALEGRWHQRLSCQSADRAAAAQKGGSAARTVRIVRQECWKSLWCANIGRLWLLATGKQSGKMPLSGYFLANSVAPGWREGPVSASLRAKYCSIG